MREPLVVWIYFKHDSNALIDFYLYLFIYLIDFIKHLQYHVLFLYITVPFLRLKAL